MIDTFKFMFSNIRKILYIFMFINCRYLAATLIIFSEHRPAATLVWPMNMQMRNYTPLVQICSNYTERVNWWMKLRYFPGNMYTALLCFVLFCTMYIGSIYRINLMCCPILLWALLLTWINFNPFLNFNRATVEVYEWISNFISYFIMDVITYACWN